ncbi:hypothetical protein BJX66DRAFT_319698, partial [Aspergillus keveii]
MSLDLGMAVYFFGWAKYVIFCNTVAAGSGYLSWNGRWRGEPPKKKVAGGYDSEPHVTVTHL